MASADRPGWSGFAAVGDFAVTQEQRGDEELVVCYELLTGKIRWSHGDQLRFSSVMGGDGPARRRPFTRDEFTRWARQGCSIASMAPPAKRLWSHDIVEENKAVAADVGSSCSPLVVDEGIVVSTGGAEK